MGNLFAQSTLFRPVPNTADTEVWDGSKWAYQSNPVTLLKDDVTDSLLYCRSKSTWGSGSVTVDVTTNQTITLETGSIANSNATLTYSLPLYLSLHKKTTLTAQFYYDTDTFSDCSFFISVDQAPLWIRFALNGPYFASGINFMTKWGGMGAYEITDSISCTEAAWHTLKIVVKGFPRDSAPAALCYIDGVLVAAHSQTHTPINANPFLITVHLNNTAINEEHLLVVKDILLIQEDL